VQLPAATAAPRLHDAPREVAIRMPRGKAANTGARGPITPATGPGQASSTYVYTMLYIVNLCVFSFVSRYEFIRGEFLFYSVRDGGVS